MMDLLLRIEGLELGSAHDELITTLIRQHLPVNISVYGRMACLPTCAVLASGHQKVT